MVSNFFQGVQCIRSGTNHSGDCIVNLFSDAGVGQNAVAVDGDVIVADVNVAHINHGCANSRDINRVRGNNHHRAGNRRREMQTERVAVDVFFVSNNELAVSVLNLEEHI